MCTQIPKMIKWNSWKSGLVSRICTEHGAALHSVCACVCTPVLPSWQVAALSLLSCLTALGPRSWLWVAAAGLASLPNSDLRGQKSHCCSQDQNSRPTNRHGGGGSRTDRQPLWASQARRGCVLPQGLPGHSCAQADLGSS